jgi:hypothetical protein
MLPMMGSLVPMADWCAADGRISPAAALALHLAAMLAVPLLAAGHVGRAGALTWGLGGVRVAMGVALGLALAMPGAQGLMPVSLCLSLAWGAAWWLQWVASGGTRPRGGAIEAPLPRVAPPAPAWLAVARACGPAAALLLLGQALSAGGPAALAWVQAALALLAVLGSVGAVAWTQWLRWRQPRPSGAPVTP